MYLLNFVLQLVQFSLRSRRHIIYFRNKMAYYNLLYARDVWAASLGTKLLVTKTRLLSFSYV